MTEGQGEIALVLEYNSIDESVTIISATELGKDFSKEDKEIQNRKLVFQYALASDLPEDLLGKLEMEQRRMHRAPTKIPGFSMGDLLGEAERSLHSLPQSEWSPLGHSDSPRTVRVAYIID